MDTTSLSVRLHVATELVREDLFAAVIYRRWDGVAVSAEVVAVSITARALTLLVPAPDPSVHTTLPPALGGPWPFAIGYLVVREAHGADPEASVAEPRVLACAPAMRVLWTSGPFPAAAFARIAEDPRTTPEERAEAIAGLERLPSGLFLARTTRRSRSLAGFSAAGDEVVALSAEDSLAWPPAVF